MNPGKQLTGSLSRSLLVVLLLLPAMRLHAGVEARVDDTTIDSMQTVLLQLRITGTNDVDALDLSPLEKDFEIQGTSQQSQLRMMNGQVSSWVDFQITLRPKRTGTLIIPPMSIGGEASQPIDITVRAIDPALQRSIDQLVYFDVEVDRAEVYVQAQLLFTRRLYYTSGVQIYGDLPGAPEIKNAVVLTLGETTQNITMRGDTRYGVLEQRYAIFPESSGALLIPGFSVAASVVLPDGRRGIRVPAADQSIKVLPIPSDYPADTTWLPARSVDIEEAWDPSLTSPAGGTTTINAGQPLQRTIVIDIAGNSASAIPPLDTDAGSPLIRHYPAAPELTDDLFGTHVTGRRTQVERLVPAWGGDLTLSHLSLTWWDTEARVVRESRLEGHQLTIRGPPPPVDDTRSTPAGGRADDRPAAAATRSGATAGAILADLRESADRYLGSQVLIVLAGLIAAGITLRLIWMRSGPSLQSAHRQQRRVLNETLQSAIAKHDPGEVRETLIRIGMQAKRCTRPKALEFMREDPDWSGLHDALCQAAFARDKADHATILAGDELRRRTTAIVKRLWRAAPGRIRQAQSLLPPLYGAAPEHS